MKQIERETMDDELYKQAIRMATRAGMPLEEPAAVNNNNNTDGNAQRRKQDAEDRKEWERQRSTHLYESEKPQPKRGVTVETGRSALSQRMSNNNSKPDLFMSTVDKSLDPKQFADSKKELQDELAKQINGTNNSNTDTLSPSESAVEIAAAVTSEIIAKAGAGKAFEGQNLGIGGLDDVLSQIKRRIWVPLAGE